MRKEIDFMGKSKIFITISLILIAISIVSIFTKGFNFGVEFTGGSEIIVRFENKEVTENDIRAAISQISEEFANARIVEVRSAGDPSNVQKYSIIVPKTYEPDEKQKIQEEMEKLLSGKVVSFNEISGTAAEEIRRGTWTAILVALVVLLIYITIRFRFIFGVAAVVALIHDVLITMGFFSLFGYEINVAAVAAFLTLLGYSLNDTIVLSDRIRENMRRYRGRNMVNIVNMSINQVLARTINTSLTTFFVVFVLLLFAGNAVKPFAFGMTVGTIVGTYSSLYVASPIIVKWTKQ
ncbi:preprotein translocase subunit SecF [Thermotoga maritima MSB8]|uniref:Protein-export membrane protein SecF n=1 Tax=Thermotoga maritima (strain ATCC 43589 / DSM 3109 / JCM 10099 / NBRC 100826 / MSB8) TaxID=243274 RepID=Q9WZW5_THEMA|nr:MULTISPECIES: protein translocase subunit SecF [Thermotoga]AAD35943.1 protein-export membrane protein SecF, putative [Thermotoga maritima MSB8]AGL49788.1 Protein-export membrane protein SecF [Thermotoga maritima MSB8]AHD17386.1 preprotein translocase subunit SecF [Thermotoga maritima MSB8]AIY85618.1 protein-export membrane protein SecF [Thermotoga sp. 2812B]AKE26775.1 preprotein translocase subunit SecF [Thermotoga maritima]